MVLFDLISIMIVPWDKFLLYHTPIRLLSAFQDQTSILIMGCVIMRFASTSLTVEIWKRKQRVIYFIKKKCHRPFAQNKKVRHVRHIFLVQVDNPFLWFLFQDCFFLLLLNCTIKKIYLTCYLNYYSIFSWFLNNIIGFMGMLIISFSIIMYLIVKNKKQLLINI